MHVLGVVGPESEVSTATDRLADRLGEDGRVAVVRRTGTERRGDSETGDDAAPRKRADRGTTTYQLGDDGWTVGGRDRSTSALLDDLAPEYDYALLADFPDADLPQVVVGDSGADLRGERLVEVDSADALDPAEVRAELDATEPHETLESLVAQVKRSADAPYAGAIATFTGRVRAKEDPDDEPTEYLEFERYERVADERMQDLAAELEAREGVHEVAMHHRTGVVEYGEDIVFVVVLAGHRSEAFRTVEDGIDRLKDEVPIFKKEVTADEQFWVHHRP
ncbi:molybdopterin synthase [Halorussus halobius]|uniref:molybdopterin synthase n=1 Tax=Halorussus halobius TaxID=1710537 RepID=UPI0010923F30|nr:molybdopterin synthase [Halorussus halobius]